LLFSRIPISSRDAAGNDESALSFRMHYVHGKLKSIAHEAATKIVAVRFATDGRPHRLMLDIDRATMKAKCDEYDYIVVRVVNEKGRRGSEAIMPITFPVFGFADYSGLHLTALKPASGISQSLDCVGRDGNWTRVSFFAFKEFSRRLI